MDISLPVIRGLQSLYKVQPISKLSADEPPVHTQLDKDWARQQWERSKKDKKDKRAGKRVKGWGQGK